MKMPDPIIEPATSMVASVSVSALTNSRDDAAVSAVTVVVVKAAPRKLGFRRVFLLLYSARKLPTKVDFC
jgi:hypothetical protein